MQSNPDPNKPDYVDQAFSAGAKKFGGAQGQKMAGDRAKSEKITDGLRKIFEKVTGKKVSSKISN
ncbi:hypothetical protein EK21DRAFT_113414 [Setomelanomma holmii]|uniref:Uncharacterized protein n=1 Tax=Setomelanomma holmii TaxID=210430 RepID=A0A9P4H8J6_9PLEO|nr:hypothetical protein EK21DRAFT_113414 [Setomelanomma holmii]